ncbi:uncharacterized protein ALTATR162_LOCUS9726 [Alternaria atra]|uniref:Uncharacterized protein n=1 Tax=Alternaria atra TaxID=119953 RepID=A0A8J2I8H0_9PLEO|nr:uncharacterized protein ALTATR162_LOCUS9726 [Alternaria atra]CAG5181366.1 unnamed protein product [Alternaria atra]
MSRALRRSVKANRLGPVAVAVNHAHTTLKRPHVPSCLYHCSILQLKATPDTLVDMHPMDRFLAAPSSYHPAIFTEAFTAGTAAADGCTCVSTSPGILASSS